MEKLNLFIGNTIYIKSLIEYDQSVALQICGTTLVIDKEIAQKVYVVTTN